MNFHTHTDSSPRASSCDPPRALIELVSRLLVFLSPRPLIQRNTTPKHPPRLLELSVMPDELLLRVEEAESVRAAGIELLPRHESFNDFDANVTPAQSSRKAHSTPVLRRLRTSSARAQLRRRRRKTRPVWLNTAKWCFRERCRRRHVSDSCVAPRRARTWALMACKRGPLIQCHSDVLSATLRSCRMHLASHSRKQTSASRSHRRCCPSSNPSLCPPPLSMCASPPLPSSDAPCVNATSNPSHKPCFLT